MNCGYGLSRASIARQSWSLPSPSTSSLNSCERNALRAVGDELLARPARRGEAAFEVVDVGLRDVDSERAEFCSSHWRPFRGGDGMDASRDRRCRGADSAAAGGRSSTLPPDTIGRQVCPVDGPRATFLSCQKAPSASKPGASRAAIRRHPGGAPAMRGTRRQPRTRSRTRRRWRKGRSCRGAVASARKASRDCAGAMQLLPGRRLRGCDRDANPGTAVSAGQTLLNTISSDSSIAADIAVDQKDLRFSHSTSRRKRGKRFYLPAGVRRPGLSARKDQRH